MPSFTTTFTSLLALSPLALAAAFPRAQVNDAVGTTRSGEITYYNTMGGTGACGTVLSDSEHIVAVSTELYDQCTLPSWLSPIPPPPAQPPLPSHD